MPRDNQMTIKELGDWGEKKVARLCSCPNCKREKTMKQLPANFKCADIICDFCGYLAQVKTTKQNSIDTIPKQILGTAWNVQKERMDSSIYFPLFLVIFKTSREFSIYYLSKDLQRASMFIPRNPLRDTARRAGWQGFLYKFTEEDKSAFIRLI